jgi:hypothetical protein
MNGGRIFVAVVKSWGQFFNTESIEGKDEDESNSVLSVSSVGKIARS